MLLTLAAYIIGFAQPFTGYQLLWLALFIVPIMSISILYASNDNEIMTWMPVKKVDYARDYSRFFSWHIVRSVPSFVLVLTVYTL